MEDIQRAQQKDVRDEKPFKIIVEGGLPESESLKFEKPRREIEIPRSEARRCSPLGKSLPVCCKFPAFATR